MTEYFGLLNLRFFFNTARKNKEKPLTNEKIKTRRSSTAEESELLKIKYLIKFVRT